MTMAIYRLSATPIQRSKGRSATAAAAYRSGERVADQRTGAIHDYRRRRGVAHTAMVGWTGSREGLWSAAELAERRKDGTPAREYQIALPVELTHGAKIDLATRFARWLHERHGVAVDVAVHDIDSPNPHAHLLCTTRVVTDDVLGDKAAVEWSDRRRREHGLLGRKSELMTARKEWEQQVNAALSAVGDTARVDCRPRATQGLAGLPEPKMGPAVTALSRDRHDHNGEVTRPSRHTTTSAHVAHLRAQRQRHRERVPAEPRSRPQPVAPTRAQMARWAARHEDEAATPPPAPTPVPAASPTAVPQLVRWPDLRPWGLDLAETETETETEDALRRQRLWALYGEGLDDHLDAVKQAGYRPDDNPQIAVAWRPHEHGAALTEIERAFPGVEWTQRAASGLYVPIGDIEHDGNDTPPNPTVRGPR